MNEVSEHESAVAPAAPTPTVETAAPVPTATLPDSSAESVAAANPISETTPGDSVPEQATPEPTAAQVARQQRLEGWQNTGTVNATDAAQLAQLPDNELDQLDLLLQGRAVTRETLAEYLQLDPNERQELFRREKLTNQLIEEKHFSEDYRDSLRDQPADELQEYLEELQQFAKADAAAEVPAEEAESNRQGLAEDLLDWAGKGGLVEQSVSKVTRARMEQEEDDQLNADAEAAWDNRASYSPEDLARHKLDGLLTDDKKAEFVAAYRAQQLLDPDYIQAREARIQKEVDKTVDIIRATIRAGEKDADELAEESDSATNSSDDTAESQLTEEITDASTNSAEAPAKQSKAKLMLQLLHELSPQLVEALVNAGNQLVDAALTNDMGELIRTLLLNSHGYSGDRGRLGGSEARTGSTFGKEHFADVIQRPRVFGKALADAYQNDEFIRAGFKIEGDVLSKLKDGNPNAIRSAMESFLTKLFDSSETSDTLARRWQVASQVLPDMINPGKKLTMDSQVKEQLDTLHRSIGVKDGAFEKTFPAVEAASQSEAVEAEPKGDTVDQQPAGTPSTGASEPQAA